MKDYKDCTSVDAILGIKDKFNVTIIAEEENVSYTFDVTFTPYIVEIKKKINKFHK